PPTVPAAPVTSSLRPPPSPSRSAIWAAVSPLSATTDAVAGSSSPGTTARSAADATTCSAWAPRSRSKPPRSPATLVPTGRSTPGPVAATVPANSAPSPVWWGWWTSPIRWKTPSAVARSTGFAGAASIATSTGPGPGARTGTSTISTESGPPGVRTTAARWVRVVEAEREGEGEGDVEVEAEVEAEVEVMVLSSWNRSGPLLHNGGVTLHEEVGTSKCVPHRRVRKDSQGPCEAETATG